MAMSLFIFHTVGISARADITPLEFFYLHLFNDDETKQNALWVKTLQHNGILS